jgi:uncharacterized protein YbaP (TraB family)
MMKMRNSARRFLALFFLLCWIAAPLPTGEAFGQEGKNFLWKVQSEASTVYLFGSIHFLKKENYPLGQAVETAFEKSDILVVEANIQDPGKVNPQAIMEKGLYPPEDSIAEHLSPETYEMLKNETAKLGLPPEFFRMQRPWLLSMTLEAMELLKLGYDPRYGADVHFLSKASGRKKILELESVDEQINLLAGLSDREQELLLRLTLKDLQTTAREVDQAVRAWKSGDTKGMEAVMTKSFQDDPKSAPLHEKLIVERNRKMVSTVEDYLKRKGAYFVVVGAGHLTGEKGIIAELRKKGYPVEQF